MNKKILIVEDNPLNMKLLNDLLQAHGYQTLQDTGGRDAISLVRKNNPGLILMDIELPDVSGLELISLLKADPYLKLIPVVAVTAFAMKGDMEKIKGAGCDEYIAKPISVSSLLAIVETFMDSPQSH